MKHKKLIHLTGSLFWFILFTQAALRTQAAVIISEDFETDGEGVRYTTSGEFSDGSGDYFLRVTGDNTPSSFPSFTGISGNGYFVVQDNDDWENPNGASSWIDFYAIEIGTGTSFTVSMDIAATLTAAFDYADDQVIVYYRESGNDWVDTLAFQNDGVDFNSGLYQDTNFDGTGDGARITPEFTTYTSETIVAPTASLDFRIEIQMTNGNEIVGVDQFKVTAVPEPATAAAAVGAILLLFVFFRRSSDLVKTRSIKEAEPR